MARYMTEAEQKFYAHALTRDPVTASYINNQVNHGQNFQQQAGHLPVSPCCEGVSLWHNGGVMCGRCGKWSPKQDTKLLRHYLRNQMYK